MSKSPGRRSAALGSSSQIDGNFAVSLTDGKFKQRDKNPSNPSRAGIVADSDPEKEYEETLHKAVGIRLAIKRWQGSSNQMTRASDPE